MKQRFLISFMTLVWLISSVQPLVSQTPQVSAAYPTPEQVNAHLKYLASDELMGRMTGEEGINKAAAYIADHFKKFGLSDPTSQGYFQRFNLYRTQYPSNGSIRWNQTSLQERTEFVTTNGSGLQGAFKVVFVGYGMPDASGVSPYTDAVKGNLVVAYLGDGKSNDFRSALPLSNQKRQWARQAGAAGLIEVFPNLDYPFQNIVPQVTRSRYVFDEGDQGREFPHWFVSGEFATSIISATSFQMDTKPVVHQPVPTQNVAGVLEGSDPVLKGEYVLLMAHYDHVGAGMRPGISPADTIFNGARDNAVGTVAIMAAAEAFAKQRPARSTLFLAVTAEEIGLLGSRYFTQHPLVPLNKIVYASNIDGAGYNDTSIVTVIGLGRTSADADIIAGTASVGLKATPDAAPEQGLFDRSDNVNFARLGIPAPTYSLGFTAFDAEINKYYHRPADQADASFDFAYFNNYVKAFIETTYRIANNPQRPRWVPGDKYEPAFKKLYGE
jgi:hypothetical protein